MSVKVLVIGYVWPEPKSSAAGSHMLSLLRLFKQQNWQVTFATPAQKTEHMIDLSLEEIETAEIQLNDSSFDDWVSKLQPDIVMFDRFMMEEQFGWRVEQACPQALRILDTEDLQSLRNARHKAIKQDLKFEISDLLSSDLAKREIAAIYRSDLSLIISDYEITLLQNHFQISDSHIHHLPFMLDLKKLDSDSPDFEQRNHFVTIGNFRHEPNWDGVLYLQSIWPLIRKELPETECHIYGSYPPKKATQLNNPKNGFLVKGWAEDVNEVMRNARVCLSPLRFGAGIKGKFIDAMQCGTPIVTTDIGAEGMTGDLPWPGLIANDVESIARNAVELYQNKNLWNKSQQAIQPLLKDRYDGEKLGKELIAKISLLQNNLTQHRQQNFIGAMLNHHTMKSTQYMSKWIEAKNKLEND